MEPTKPIRTATLDSLSAINACADSVAWIKQRGLYDGQQAWDQMDVGAWMLHWVAACADEHDSRSHRALIWLCYRVVRLGLQVVQDDILPLMEMPNRTDNAIKALCGELGVADPAAFLESMKTVPLTAPYDRERARKASVMLLLALVVCKPKDRCHLAAMLGWMVGFTFEPRERGRVSRMIAVLCRSESATPPLAKGCKPIEETPGA